MPRARRGSVAGLLSPTSKNVAALFTRREEKLSEEQKEYLERLCDSDRALADARRLTQDFAKMVRDLEGEKLDGWLEEAEACGAPAMRRNCRRGPKKGPRRGEGGADGNVEQRPRRGVRSQAQAAETPGLRQGGLRAAASEDAGRLKTARSALQEGTHHFTRKPTEPRHYGCENRATAFVAGPFVDLTRLNGGLSCLDLDQSVGPAVRRGAEVGAHVAS